MDTQSLMEKFTTLIMLKKLHDLYKECVMWFKSNGYKYYWTHALSFYIKLKTAHFFYKRKNTQEGLFACTRWITYDISAKNRKEYTAQSDSFLAYFGDLPGHTSIIFPFDMHGP